MKVPANEITLVQCIEGKENYEFEENFRTFVDSAKKFNYLEDFKDRKIYLPSTFDVNKETKEIIKDNKFQFIRKDFKVQVLNKKNQNFFNMTNVCYDASINTSGYMLWTDLDILVLRKFKDLKVKPNHILANILKFDKEHELENFERIYNEYFEPLTPEECKPTRRFDYYINTCILFGHTKNKFWREWKELTFYFKEHIESIYPENEVIFLEGYCEEMAATLLYFKDPSRFTSLPKEYHIESSFQDVVLWHYEEYSYLFNTLTKKNKLKEFKFAFNNPSMLLKKNILSTDEVMQLWQK